MVLIWGIVIKFAALTILNAAGDASLSLVANSREYLYRRAFFFFIEFSTHSLSSNFFSIVFENAVLRSAAFDDSLSWAFNFLIVLDF